MNDPEKKYGALALSLCLGGLFLAMLIGMTARLCGYDANMPAYLIFLGFQIGGFVLGIVSRQEALGKTAYITSAVMGGLSVVFLC